MDEGTIQLISNEPQQLYIEYSGYEKMYRRARIAFGALFSVVLVFIGILIDQALYAVHDRQYGLVIISVTMIPILLLVGYSSVRSYRKAVTFHEQYKSLRKAVEPLL